MWLILTLTYYGCQTNSTFYDLPINVCDQVFELPENSPEGTVIGQIEVSDTISRDLSYYLVAGDYSNFFELGVKTGILKLRTSSAVDYEQQYQIDLEVMVTSSERKDVGNFANITIRVTDVKEPVSWLSDSTSGINQDAIVNSLQPDTNYGQSEYNIIDSWTNNLNPFTTRAFIQFDVSTIPVDAQVTEATLLLYNPHDTVSYHKHSSFSGANSFYIRKVSSKWDSQEITWNNQPVYETDEQISVPASKSNDQDYVIDVTKIVQEMVLHPEANYGFLLMLVDEEYYRRLCFTSLEYQDSSLRPQLQINYLY